MVLDGALTAGALPTSPQHILDVGTGTGIWAIEMGDCYPSAIVTGVDISPIQPTWVPANVNFELDDVTKPWVWPQTSMDFIHIRNLVGSIRDYPALFAEAFRTLKPGGVIEVSEIRARFECQDGSFALRGRACRQWENTFHAIAKEGGWDFDPITKVPRWLEEAGFAEVQALSRLVPVGAWPKEGRLKEIGRWHLSHMLHGGMYSFSSGLRTQTEILTSAMLTALRGEGMENYSMMLFTRAGWDPAAVHALLREVEREVQDPMMHSFTKACFVTATKPPLP